MVRYFHCTLKFSQNNNKIWKYCKSIKVMNKCRITEYLWSYWMNIQLLKMFRKKYKFLHLEPKMPSLGILVAILKKYFHIWSYFTGVCLIVKFSSKLKILKFKTKMPYLDIFVLKIENNIVLFEISALGFV